MRPHYVKMQLKRVCGLLQRKNTHSMEPARWPRRKNACKTRVQLFYYVKNTFYGAGSPAPA